MTERKSFNKAALRGEAYDDLQWQKDFAESTGIVIPEQYLFSVKGPKYAIDMMYEQNKQDYIQRDGLSEKAAHGQANASRTAALADLKRLL